MPKWFKRLCYNMGFITIHHDWFVEIRASDIARARVANDMHKKQVEKILGRADEIEKELRK